MKKVILPLLGLFLLSGCYEQKALDAYKKLEVGMNKQELQRLLNNLKFIKEQPILKYGSSSEQHMRGSLTHNKSWKDRQPKDLIDHLTFDGNIKVYSYLIKEEHKWPDYIYTYYIAVFYNENEDRVMGKAILSTDAEPRVWDPEF
jgi:hypothetical protein